VMKRTIQFNLALAAAVTVALWIAAFVASFQYGFTWWLFYLAAGGLTAILHLTTSPFYYFRYGAKNAAAFSFGRYLYLLAWWLPTNLTAVYQALREILTWDDETFRVERMMETAMNEYDQGIYEEYPEGG
jgi:hypothetical protein